MNRGILLKLCKPAPNRSVLYGRRFFGHVSEEVRQAVSENSPVVALESTIITHGLPYPENLEMAKSVESIIRESGAIPATIGFVKGVPTVGVSDDDLILLGQPEVHNVKISRRDIPNVMARKLTGGTTIASTMMLANNAGIDIFSTGGLGGVSRPWSLFDVSADLEELGQTPVAVVCSGPKSILDIQRTMEYLETKGVPVSTYIDEAMKQKIPYERQQRLNKLSESTSEKDLNEINHFWELQQINVPGFYVRDSGVRSPFVWENPEVAANMIFYGKYNMNMKNGYVFCAPAPLDVALEKSVMDKVIDEALYIADEKNINGKNLTPFLLKTLYEKTYGESAKCNVEFVKNNARLGAKIANALSLLKGGKRSQAQPIFEPKIKREKVEIGGKGPEENVQTTDKVNAVVVGSVALDTMCQIKNKKLLLKDSNPGKIVQSGVGGVGFNVAYAATVYDPSSPIILITAINETDHAGLVVLQKLCNASMPVDGLVSLPGCSTAQYISMHDSVGNLAIACADMEIVEHIPIDHVTKVIRKYEPKIVLFDANISTELMQSILNQANGNMNLIFEPTSGVKCSKIGQLDLPVFPLSPFELVTPTVEELSVIFEAFSQQGKFDDIDNWFSVLDYIGIDSEFRERLTQASHKYPLIEQYLVKGVYQQAFQLLPYFPVLLIKDGANGLMLIEITKEAKEAAENVSKYNYKFVDGRPTGSDFVFVGEGRHNLGVIVQHFPAHHADEIVNVTGAGDCLAGCLLSELSSNNSTSEALRSLSINSHNLREMMFHNAQECAISSIQSPEAVSPQIRSRE